MPVYDYLCPSCGPFSQLRPMAEYRDPQDCPVCRTAAPRALLVAPRLAGMPADRRKAIAINERSAHAPRTLDQHRAAHPSGCSCCSGKSTRPSLTTPSGARGFPTARPWMISH